MNPKRPRLDALAERLGDWELWLSEPELRALILSACEAEEGATEAQMAQVVRWAVETRMQAKLLEMVLRDDLRVTAGPGDDVSFRTKEVAR